MQEGAFPERDLQIHNTSAFILDLDKNVLSKLEVSDSDVDYLRFVQGIVHEVSTQDGRQFIVDSEHTEVIGIINDVIDESLEFDQVQIIAERLLRIEIGAQEQIAKLGKQLHEGLLIISHITDRDTEKIIICKAETLSFIERTTFTQQDGFPIKKKIFKSAQIVFDETHNITDILINDINDTIPKYWWEGFLELSKKYDDEENTRRAFTMIDSKVLIKIKKESNSDYWNLRSTTIHYFRSNEEFDIEDYIEKCFNRYAPEMEGLDINKFKDTIRELPRKQNFDMRFSLVRKAITAKIKSTIKLEENIDLVLKGEVHSGTIEGVMNGNQEKGIFIKTSKGYDEFKKS
ncbi:hypothetical protein [Chryseobacterium sp. JAH]|uniref:hypothetical protein n=1 Tax=Chryseobacterium sp. JAH TaxID=1742858 RepID=UPI000A513EAC|nr:hypothetical protein [Chryseobacterium sp. JAH]